MNSRRLICGLGIAAVGGSAGLCQRQRLRANRSHGHAARRGRGLRLSALTWISALVVGLASFGPGRELLAQELQPTEPLRETVAGSQDELDQLIKDFRRAGDKFVTLLSKVRPTLKTREEMIAFVAENDPSPSFAKRAIAIAERNPKTIVGVLSLRFACACGYTSSHQELNALKADALKHLEDHYIDEKWFWAFLPTVALETHFYDVKPFLRRCLEKSAHREVRGQACFYLASLSLRTHRFLNERGQTLPKEDEQEMFACYEQCIKEFGDLPTADTTIATVAERSLFEIRNLIVGKLAPEIAGEDIDGAALDLDDQRGKVVLLTFWGDWCGPCRELLSHEQSLADKFKDRRFVLIGVNSDSRDRAKKAVEREKLTWRSFWDGGDSSGPIATMWNVNSWPVIYLLDHKGTIRFKYYSKPSEAELAKSIDELLSESVTH